MNTNILVAGAGRRGNSSGRLLSDQRAAGIIARGVANRRRGDNSLSET